jgi:AcrR family transcriptional regulator
MRANETNRSGLKAKKVPVRRTARRHRSGPTKGERTQARLIDAAIAEFAARGLERTKISDIVARAKLSQPAFYLYFDTKDRLYEHLVSRVRKELLAIIRRVRVPSNLDRATARRGMTAAIREFLQYFADNPALGSIGYFQTPRAQEIHKEIVAFVAANIVSEQASGYLRHDLDPDFASECYVGTLDRIISRYVLTGKSSPEKLADDVADVYLRGIEATKT